MATGALFAPILGAFADAYSARKASLLLASSVSVVGAIVFPSAVIAGKMSLSLGAATMALLGFQLSMGLYNSMLVYVFPSNQRCQTRHLFKGLYLMTRMTFRFPTPPQTFRISLRLCLWERRRRGASESGLYLRQLRGE